jgi:DNA-binding NarL/FixJ family response regulator
MKILLVEDHPIFRFGVRHLIQQPGGCGRGEAAAWPKRWSRCAAKPGTLR